MKKILITAITIFLGIMILFGCSNNSNKKNETINDSNKSLNDSNSKSNGDKKVANESPDGANDKNNSNKKATNEKNNSKSKLDTLLLKIKVDAIKGQVINSNYKLGDSIDSVIEKLGRPSSESYVESAKGDYFKFDSNNLIFGCNKGEQIFEIRSLDKSLDELNLNNVENFFGKPDYNITTKLNEKIIGYKISGKFKILFVFDNKNSKLKHYSVLYPELTKNSMVGDKGREW
ncbi:YjgB family protein [Clostridium baratii]|uniref:YjgB family protein n=1 Tax=Clostridium baratii TaxID=1561 RepID=UPI0028FFF6B9|nr:YjgB family protein [Clostridium baratii]MDU1055050.1 YjgB family protein [Clostridium baratii]